jgi:hypothetical protein
VVVGEPMRVRSIARAPEDLGVQGRISDGWVNLAVCCWLRFVHYPVKSNTHEFGIIFFFFCGFPNQKGQTLA